MKITRRQLRRIIKEEKKKLLNEGFRMVDLASEAAQALEAGNADRLMGLQHELQGALMPEDDLRAWEILFDAMIDAAYAVQERDDLSEY